MPLYSLRTLLILLAVGPPLAAWVWWGYQREVERRRQADFDRLIELIETTIVPESWNHMDGPGSLDQFDEALNLVPARLRAISHAPYLRMMLHPCLIRGIRVHPRLKSLPSFV